MKKASAPKSSWAEAVDFAAKCHEHQYCADGKTPYIAHPIRVATILMANFRVTDPQLIAVALLHDVIEKAGTRHDELARRFGAGIAGMVSDLSKDYRLPDGKAAKDYFSHLSSCDQGTRLVKLADAYDHLKRSEPRDKKRKQKALKALALAEGDHPSLVLARQLVLEELNKRRKVKRARSRTT